MLNQNDFLDELTRGVDEPLDEKVAESVPESAIDRNESVSESVPESATIPERTQPESEPIQDQVRPESEPKHTFIWKHNGNESKMTAKEIHEVNAASFQLKSARSIYKIKRKTARLNIASDELLKLSEVRVQVYDLVQQGADLITVSVDDVVLWKFEDGDSKVENYIDEYLRNYFKTRQ